MRKKIGVAAGIIVLLYGAFCISGIVLDPIMRFAFCHMMDGYRDVLGLIAPALRSNRIWLNLGSADGYIIFCYEDDAALRQDESTRDKFMDLMREYNYVDRRIVVMLRKGRNEYSFFLPIKKGLDQDPEMILNCKTVAKDMSRRIFGGKRVDIHLCDEFLNTLRVVMY